MQADPLPFDVLASGMIGYMMLSGATTYNTPETHNARTNIVIAKKSELYVTLALVLFWGPPGGPSFGAVDESGVVCG